MAVTQPSAADVERAVVELLREEEVGAVAVLDENGFPSAAMMHFVGDGLTAYLHTFTYTRKYESILRDLRVGYTLAHMPADGFAGRLQARHVQVTGRASFVNDPEEVERVLGLSHEQFEWLRDSPDMYENFRRAGVRLRQVFFRVDPVEGVWQDNRVRMMYRTKLRFTEDGRHVAELVPYPMTGPSVPSPLAAES
ncbi:pyridoxamine 5'-phosphate oxidase family protein [Streptomyces sp. LP11]|uniref:Pyridoxamine 5'-phosphate oxidase family protein n=1 Tax=Streptomyces pyxinicus TaxID=2970331 RepID=A0ABT2AUY3_9ACTN|nr:pyridoxamine 5'-phosphate oxidase family protein [Streptomyces sp. LP11]MCS0599715.1 pyridoxamine 5'-phosphate oxidase family protein [Streptomyces sp. LP11]